MSTLTKSITSVTANPWFDVLLFIIAILGIAGTVYFYYKGKREKLPYYYKTSTNIFQGLNDKFKDLNIFYADTSIKNMTVTFISFWNGGRETIRKEDIVHKVPLTIKMKEDYQILDVKMTCPDGDANNFSYSISEDLSSLNFTFDYIDRNNGVKFQILHSGLSSKSIELTGKIIGAGKITYFSDFQAAEVPSFISNRIHNHKHLKLIKTIFNAGAVSFVTICSILLLIMFYFAFTVSTSPIIKIIDIIMIVLLCVCILISAVILPNSLTKQVPPEFDLSYENDLFE